MMTKIDNMIAEQKIKSLSVNIASQLDMPEITTQSWLGKLFPVLQDFYYSYGGNHQLAIVISESSLPICSSIAFEPNTLWGFVSKGIECFLIDIELRFCLAPLGNSESVTVSDYSYQNKVPALHVLGEDCHLYNREGRSVAFYNFAHPEVQTVRRMGKDARSYKDYKLIIDEQATKQLVHEIDVIWHDRNKRILIGNRRTEKVLQKFLRKWLSENIYDAKVVSEVGKISGIDKTDIELTSIQTGDSIIIEVKWMGKNVNGTSYDIERLKEGIKQVCTYLERDPNALEGCVVCYDGRQTSSKFSLKDPIAKLEYRIVWLESRSGSQIGEER